MCKTPIAEYGGQVSVGPMKAFAVIKDLVTDVSWNYQVNKEIPPFTPSDKDLTSSEPWRMQQKDVERVMEFRKCIECFLCQDVCHVLRAHDLKGAFQGPRFMVRIASLEMHPKDALDRRPLLKGKAGIGYCNVTKCCTEVCPKHIHITDNAIIPSQRAGWTTRTSILSVRSCAAWGAEPANPRLKHPSGRSALRGGDLRHMWNRAAGRTLEACSLRDRFTSTNRLNR